MFDAAGPVVGIDPGVSRCGYGAVASGSGGSLVAEAFGVIRTEADEGLPARLAVLERELDELVGELRPRALAVERVLFQVNTRTAMSVGQASGLALAVAGRTGVPVFHYSPNEVKLAVTGDGTADKAQVQTMVARLLSLDRPPRPADAADALGLAVCHLGSAGLRTAVAAGAPVPDGLARAVGAALAKEAGR
ncbi:MAG TPA: crossover junction endodeoxyribonuclease RuvC [Acidimicrobiia bacterium]|nr:crossover junction endodeoxyribonuclease RuvC [Acidimicrobiia bacterium]